MLIGLIGLVLPSLPARATTQADVQAQIDQLGSQIAALDEQYNQATIHLQAVQSQIRDSQAASARAQTDFVGLQKEASAQAAAVYKAGAPSLLVAFLTSKNFDDFNQKMQMISQVNDWQSGIMNRLQIADQRAKQATDALNSELSQAKAIDDGLAKQRSDLQARLSQEQRLLAQIDAATRLAAQQAAQARADAVRATLLREETAAAAAAAAARSSATSGPGFSGSPPSGGGSSGGSSGGGSSGGGSSGGGFVAEAGGAAHALNVAMAQIGKPYVWAGSGPATFDCSGLTMFAWGAAGVSLPHSAAGQYASERHVGRDQLQPGDLVFFGSPIHHVGMYVGNGMMVDAPETGESVHVQSMARSDYVGAALPGV